MFVSSSVVSACGLNLEVHWVCVYWRKGLQSEYETMGRVPIGILQIMQFGHWEVCMRV